MSESNRFVIHIVVELMVLIIVSLYFKRQLGTIYTSLTEIQGYLRNQDAVLRQHDALLSQLMGAKPVQHCILNPIQVENKVVPPPPPSPEAVDAPSLMPMVENLMGMLGTVASMSNTGTEPPSPPSIDIEQELKEELQELGEEGRLE